MFNKYINRVGANYIVVFEEEIDENKKIEIIRLAKTIGISEDNQRNILLLIEKHNNMILKQKEEKELQAEREKLMLAIEQIKTTYFTEDMHFAYNKVRCIVNDICLIKDQSLNYIIAKLKVAKEIIDATILGLIKEELTLEDFNELLYLSFEDLNNVLIEAKHYKIINQSLERIKKES